MLSCASPRQPSDGGTTPQQVGGMSGHSQTASFGPEQRRELRGREVSGFPLHFPRSGKNFDRKNALFC